MGKASIKAILPGLIVLAIAACAPAGEPPLEDYLARLGRSLQRDIATPSPAWPAYPRSREMVLPVSTGSIDLLDMLALGDCALDVTIGKANSSLGRLATDSQRLLLELEFLRLAPACISSLNPGQDGELVETLAAAVESKRQQLPARVWNATLGGPEFRAFWKRPPSLSDYPAQTGVAVVTALARLAELVEHWLGGDYDVGAAELEPLLDQVRRGDGGALLAALAIQGAGLGSAAPAIDDRLRRAPLCFDSTPSMQGEILDNVVRKFFVGQVQPWSVKLERRRQLLLPHVTAIEQQLGAVSPPAFRQWREDRNQLLEISAGAPRDHALALAALLESCGLRPGAAQPGAAQPGAAQPAVATEQRSQYTHRIASPGNPA